MPLLALRDIRCLLLTLLALSPTGLCAQLSETDRARLADEVDAAAENLDPDQYPELQPAKQAVLRQIQAVDDFLLKKSPINREGWLRYLDMQPLQQALESDDSISTISREASNLRFRLIGTAPGLDLDSFVSLRESVERLITAIKFRDPDRVTGQITNQLQVLSKTLRALDESPSSSDVATMTAILGNLESANQAESTIASLRSVFRHPNLSVTISESLVQQVARRDVHQTRPVRDCILGTRIVGNATMTGLITADLLPATGAAQIQLSLNGQIVSNNTGYNGPVRLRTVSNGDVNASRMLHINESGIRLDPSHVRAELWSDIRSIHHHLGLVRKIARKRAAQQKPMADRIAVKKMRIQVGEQFNEQTDRARSFKPPERVAKIRPILKRLALFEPPRLWGSTDDSLFIDATFRSPDQLAAVVPRPTIEAPCLIAFQVHESVVNNAFTPILSGRTMNETQVNELLDAADRPVPDAKEGEESDPPFEIDFARLQPVVFAARDQTVRIGIRGTRFAQGRRELKRAMEIAAVYRTSTASDGRTVLVREGEVEVVFPGNRPLTISQAGLKPTIKKKFANVFPETLLNRPWKIPTTAKIEPLRGREFQPCLVDAKDGWLTIAAK